MTVIASEPRSLAPKPMTKTDKKVYYFGKTQTEGNGSQRTLLGGKGANLADMTSIGLPVPPGFTITTETCAAYDQAGGRLPAGLMDEVRRNIEILQQETGKTFGDAHKPLLVSVRSGAAVSMPGMMDTVLNLGLTDETVEGLAAATGNERFAYDAYRRLINMFGDVVMGVDHHHFEAEFDKIKKKYAVQLDTDVPAEGIRQLCDAYKKVYRRRSASDFPQDAVPSARAGDRGGVQVVERAARDPLPANQRNHRAARHGRQRPGHGLRQHG